MNKRYLFGFIWIVMQFAAASALAMGSAPSHERELKKMIQAEGSGEYTTCDRGFHFYFFNTPFSKAVDNAEDAADERAEDKCENVLGGKFEKTHSWTKNCRPIPGYWGSCGFECTAVTKGKCILPEPGKDSRANDGRDQAEKDVPEIIKVDGIEFLIDQNGDAHRLEKSLPSATEAKD